MTDISLDHVGAMVRDLDTAAARWRRLGFQLAPRSPQMGYDKETGTIQPWATANHVAMFRRGYLELIGVVDPAKPNPWARFIDRFEGGHIVAFRCAEADAGYAALSRRAPGFDPPLDRRRMAPFGDGLREMRFRNIFSQDAHYPEGRFIVIEHQTPEVLWQDALMVQPNGALSLDEVVFCAADFAATRERIGRIVGVPAEEEMAGEVRFAPAVGGRVTVLDEAGFARRFPGAVPPPRPCVAAVTVGFADLGAARRMMTDAGVALHDGPRDPGWVAAADANGLVIALAQA